LNNDIGLALAMAVSFSRVSGALSGTLSPWIAENYSIVLTFICGIIVL